MYMLQVILPCLIFIIISKDCDCQIDGEFWWLNDKITELKAIKPEPPRFETLNKFETDENDVIVFKEDSMFEPNRAVYSAMNIKDPSTERIFFFEDIESDLNNTTQASNASKQIEVLTTPFLTSKNATTTKLNIVITNDGKVEQINNGKATEAPIEPTKTERNPRHDLRDRLTFGIVERPRQSPISWPTETKREDRKPNTVAFRSEKLRMVENACVCVSKGACKRLGGVLSTNESTSRVCTEDSYCCVPANEILSKIVFPDQTPKRRESKPSTQRVRFARSADTKRILGQHAALRAQKPQPIFWERVRTIDSRPPPPINRDQRRIVTEDDDPYWNIKNILAIANVSRPRPKITTGYGTPDYDDDYTMELPRPGLHVYSEETPRPMDQSWGDDDVYSYGSFGSPVLDPRYDQVTISTGISVKPIPKPTQAPESEEIIDEETEFANSYNAAHYQAFEDFKLPSLFKKKSRRTTERPPDYDSLESVAVTPNKLKPLEPAYFGKKEQAYAKCGETPFDDEDGNNFGAARSPRYGSRPWLCLVTQGGEGSPRCSATLLHPRAALTSASCVHGARSGELTVRCGEWELGADSEPLAPQRRRAAARAHQLYRAGDLTNDLAVLYWESSMELCASVQPACLEDPLDGDTCVFVGWGVGSADNMFHRRPREQRAVVLSTRACTEHVARVADAAPARGVFCARALTHGCAAGGGGALVCGARRSAVGVATWRASCDASAPVVLNAARDWTLRTLRDLGII